MGDSHYTSRTADLALIRLWLVHRASPARAAQALITPSVGPSTYLVRSGGTQDRVYIRDRSDVCDGIFVLRRHVAY